MTGAKIPDTEVRPVEAVTSIPCTCTEMKGRKNEAGEEAYCSEENIMCAAVYAPVCAFGITYSSACEAKRDGVTLYTDGQCTCACPKIFDLVCVNGEHFGNPCLARCKGYANFTRGPCQSNTNTTSSGSLQSSGSAPIIFSSFVLTLGLMFLM